MLIVVVASLATLRYFAYGLAGIGKAGNRRAALERARQRLEQLIAADSSLLSGDENVHWVTCTGTPCTWTKFNSRVTESVAVDDLPSEPMETTVQKVNDPVSSTTPDQVHTVILSVKVWFTPNPNLDADDNNVKRVLVRSLRSPPL